MFGSKVASTHDVIERLQQYEKEHGVGAIVGVSIHMNGDRENEFCFEIANDSNGNRFYAEDVKYKKTDVEIPSVLDNTLFPDRFEDPFEKDKNIPQN